MSVTLSSPRRPPTPCAPRPVFPTAIGAAQVPPGPVMVVPWVAHARWHAYRNLVDTSGLSELP